MKVKITLLEEVLGSSPSNEELLATYIASKAPTGDLTTEEVDNIKAQNAEDRVTVFPKTADGTPFLYDYQVKGMFKDSCKMLARLAMQAARLAQLSRHINRPSTVLFSLPRARSPTTCTA